MKKFKEKIYDGLPSQKKKKKKILGFFPWNFPKEQNIYTTLQCKKNRVKNDSIVHFEQKV